MKWRLILREIGSRWLGAALLSSLWFAPIVLLHAPKALAENTLFDAMLGAQENSTSLERQQSKIRSAVADIAIARAALQPQIFVEVGAGVFTRKELGTSESQRTDELRSFSNVGLSFTQTIWDGYERNHAIDAKLKRKLAEQSRLEYFKQQEFMNAIKAYFNLQHDRAVKSILQYHLDIVKREAALEANRYEHNEATLTDVALVRSYLGTIETAYLSAGASLANSIARYKKETGLVPNGGFQAFDIGKLQPSTLDEAIKVALVEHPLLQTNRYLAEQASHQLSKEQAKTHPKLYVNGQVSSGEFPNHQNREIASLGLRLKVPLFQERVTKNRIVLGQEAKFRAELKQRDEMQQILEDVEFVFNAAATARGHVQSARRTSSSAAEAYKSAVEERDFKLRSTPEMFEVHSLYYQALLDEIDAERNLHLAEYGVLFSMGRLTPFLPNQMIVSVPVPRPKIETFEVQNGFGSTNDDGSPDHWEGLRISASDIVPERKQHFRIQVLGR